MDQQQQHVAQICEMGYSKEQAEKALEETKSIEAALEWLVNHGDDVSTAPQAKSIRCTTTGKLFRTMADATIYAERTGHASFEECEEEIPPLTPEEKLERIQKAKELIKLKLAQRAETDKKDALEKERLRRAGGQEMGKIREEQEVLQRKRDAEERDREKARVAAQAKRLHEQVALDKANRAFEKAKRLGDEDPKVAYDLAYKQAMKTDEKTPGEKADLCLKIISLSVKGNKLDCVQTIAKLLSNIMQQPDEPKFRKINLSNDKIKEKIVNVNGGVVLLKAAGFEEQEGGHLVLDGNDLDRVQQVLARIQEFKF
ncbi:hypothetical protein BASA81_000824 [Batrachochytrium salamandrivorans]|nr:hypothetical protein BASA81_000824 [Batrachochytrium salamandrivorans]